MVKICCLHFWLWNFSLGLSHVLLWWRPMIKPATIITSLWGLVPLLIVCMRLRLFGIFPWLKVSAGMQESEHCEVMAKIHQINQGARWAELLKLLALLCFLAFTFPFGWSWGFFTPKHSATPYSHFYLIHNISAWLRKLNSDAHNLVLECKHLEKGVECLSCHH